MVSPASNGRAPRQVLSSVNAGPNTGDQASDGGSLSGVEFGSREDVERLLGEKMKGKNKNDYKAAIKSYVNERGTRVAVENSRDALSAGLERVTQEKKCAVDQRADLTATETMTEYEEQKKTVKNLQERLVDAELQIVEAEKLRKKLHNTILVLVLIYLNIYYKISVVLNFFLTGT
ncbi:hypothetical protein GW17_00020299 [Ensete ventricosum]|nr:hypothetical protein GW17_00020299 [Ensete ventricosum]